MALGATIYKAVLEISDLDDGYYGTRTLTIARHPSETEERLMVRLLAFCLYADETITFGRGLSADGEPALYDLNAAGDIGRWIEVGCPDNKTLRKAAGKSEDVVVLTYGESRVDAWWQSNKGDFGKIDKLTIRMIKDEDLARLTAMCSRNMHLAATIQDGVVWIADDKVNEEIHVENLMTRGEPVF